MLPKHRPELRAIIDDLFKKGINKRNTFAAMEQFIDIYYIEHKHHSGVLEKELSSAGSYWAWRGQLKKEIKEDILESLQYSKNNSK